MAEVTFDVTPATPKKRAYEDHENNVHGMLPNVPSAVRSSTSEHTSRNASPTPSSTSSLTELTSVDATNPAPYASHASGRPSKKPKLTFLEKEAEKAAKQRERDEKARVKAEEKARKDEERRKANEEKEAAKRSKELERAEKQKARDAEKKEKEARRQADQQKKDAKEAERLKRERAQMRLGAFFGKPKPEATPPSTPDDVSEGASSRRSSIVSINMEGPVLDCASKSTVRPANPDYEKFVLPFFVPEHTQVAPSNRFKLGKLSTFEFTEHSTSTRLDVRQQFDRPRRLVKRTIPIREIMRNVQASSLEVIDIGSTALKALQEAPYKCLQFREDVRPPYQGTYTRPVSPRSSKKLARNPFSRSLPDTNYDYDSEAEWEPPGEDDEDLENEDEMSDAEDNEEEMEDFLDDADDAGRKKGPTIDMEPISSGLCWVGEEFNDNGLDIRQYKMDFLHDATTLPIDPFSTQHWIDENKNKTTLKSDLTLQPMPPPRQALSSLSPNAGHSVRQDTGIDGKPLPIQPRVSTSSNKKQVRMIEPEFMPAFKQAIDGNDMTKAGLIEVLKKQFPKCSKDAIKDTLSIVAVRVGKKESEKRWQLVQTT